MRTDSDSLWLKAAVAGGLWASFEIIVGSMLHNLHLPFSGTILALFSVLLMISFLQVWNFKGLIWRAGIICGLMKSLSPSAVILGPMTGIMMEAVIMDIFIYLLGRNLIGYLFAGIGALLSTILHKLFSLFILYGKDLVTIYINLFNFIEKQLQMEFAGPKGMILMIILIYVFLGAFAAISGYLLGRSAIRNRNGQAPVPDYPDPYAASWKNSDHGQSFRIALLIIHILMIPSMLILINHYGLTLISVIPAILYITFLLIYYKRILGRLKKPLFWSQLLLMTVIAGLFWNPPGMEKIKMGSGLIVGLEMSLRAVLIVSAFSGLSVEIRNPRITERLLDMRFGNAYAALSLSFNSLPVMLDRSLDFRSFIKRPFKSFAHLITDAELWLKCYQTHLKE